MLNDNLRVIFTVGGEDQVDVGLFWILNNNWAGRLDGLRGGGVFYYLYYY